jgi:hypothetical protein
VGVIRGTMRAGTKDRWGKKMGDLDTSYAVANWKLDKAVRLIYLLGYRA